MPPASSFKADFLRINQADNDFYLVRMEAKDLVHISYVARRGETNESGAVQRLLSPKRISSVSSYAQEVGIFPSCIVLNWVNKSYPLKFTTKTLTIPKRKQSAQIIDGQHRVAGLEEAIQEKKSVGNLQIPVAIYNGLDTRRCADIFLSINTEQKPVPKSLVFDLYGDASEFIVDVAAVRAKDIAQAINENEESPYLDYIKFPGASKSDKGIQLSTVVTALKPLVEENGAFEQVGLTELHMQEQALLNFLWAIQDQYEDEWDNPKNAFRTAAGFTGAIDFYKNRMMSYCNIKQDFSLERILGSLVLPQNTLLFRDDLKGLQGRKATNTVSDYLEENFKPETGTSNKIRL